MASQTAREWIGIQQFPAATQTKLTELLGMLKQENVSTLTVLVMGKGGMGKSSTVNSILGERVASVSAFQSEGLRLIICSRTWAGFTLNIIDTPGIVEGVYINEQAVGIIKRFILNKTIDVFLYVDRLNAYRMDTLDKQVSAITDIFGKIIWRRSLVVLTHAQLSPPDGLNYDDFVARRSEALLNYVCLVVEFQKRSFKFSSPSSPAPTLLIAPAPAVDIEVENNVYQSTTFQRSCCAQADIAFNSSVEELSKASRALRTSRHRLHYLKDKLPEGFAQMEDLKELRREGDRLLAAHKIRVYIRRSLLLLTIMAVVLALLLP